MPTDEKRTRRERITSALAVYAVTDPVLTPADTIVPAVTQALDGGATFIQLRDKTATRGELISEARVLGALCRERGIPFVVDDDVQAAKEAGADGVHVGQSDASCIFARAQLGPEAIIGVSVQTPEQARIAECDGADYLGVGAMFPTSTKQDAAHVSISTLEQICASVSIPVVAIGGIDADNIRKLIATGIAGVAVVSAIFASPDIRCAANKIEHAVRHELAKG